MPRFFKGTEKQSFSYPTIVEVRKGSSYTGWIIGIIVVILVTGAIFLLFNN